MYVLRSRDPQPEMRKPTLLMTMPEGGIGGVSLFSVFTKTNNPNHSINKV